jgi:hypothetical protein
MTQAPVIEPVDPAASETPPVEPQQPVEPPSPEEQTLPPELLKIPAFQAVLVGTPPAISMSIKGSEDRDEVALVTENKDALLAAGMGFYRSMSGELGVMFNALKVHPDDLKAADKAGQLTQLAPNFDTVNQEVAKSGKNHPLLQAGPPSAALPSARSSLIAPQAQSGSLPLVPPAPASVARKLAAQRVLNLSPGAPTSGAAPGAGRILNQVLKTAV